MRLGSAPSKAASRNPAVCASASQAAMSMPDIAMRTMPCTSTDDLHLDGREALGEPGPEIDRGDAFALHHARDLFEDFRNRRHGGREIAPEIGTAGDALLGLEIDQQQWRLGDHAPAGSERVGHRHLDADRAYGADGEERRGGAPRLKPIPV